MITIAVQEGRIEEAKAIGARFENNAAIQNQMITIAIQEGRLEEAKAIGARFKNYAPIQSQMITIAVQEGRIEEAKAIGIRFENDAAVQSQMITIAMKAGRIEEAKAIGVRFENDAPIQSQMVTIAMQEGKLENAKATGESFKDYAPIQSQMKKIQMQENRIEETLDKEPITATERENLLNEIKTKIYYGSVDGELLEQIQQSQILSQYEKTVILLAICEKQKMSTRVKQIASGFESDDQMQNKTIKQIMERNKNKKPRIFPWEFYNDILNWKLDKELSAKFEKERETEER